MTSHPSESDLPLTPLEQAIDQAVSQYFRLVILAGPPCSGKTAVLQAIAQTPAGTKAADLQGPYLPSGAETGTIGLYYVDFASPSQNIAVVHPVEDTNDPCTAGQRQI